MQGGLSSLSLSLSLSLLSGAEPGQSQPAVPPRLIPICHACDSLLQGLNPVRTNPSRPLPPRRSRTVTVNGRLDLSACRERNPPGTCPDTLPSMPTGCKPPPCSSAAARCLRRRRCSFFLFFSVSLLTKPPPSGTWSASVCGLVCLSCGGSGPCSRALAALRLCSAFT